MSICEYRVLQGRMYPVPCSWLAELARQGVFYIIFSRKTWFSFLPFLVFFSNLLFLWQVLILNSTSTCFFLLFATVSLFFTLISMFFDFTLSLHFYFSVRKDRAIFSAPSFSSAVACSLPPSLFFVFFFKFPPFSRLPALSVVWYILRFTVRDFVP